MYEHQKHLVVYWHSKNKNATDIHRKLCKYFPYEKISYSTITDWIRKINRGEDIFERKTGSGRISDLQIDQRILNALNEMPFHSIRTLSNQLKIPKTTVFNHMRSMGFIIKHLRFVPHTLNDSQKVQRVNYSKHLLDIIKQARHQSWAFFLTGDESWFYFINDFEQQWLQPNEKPSTKPKTIISTPKRMLTVFWSPLGFRIVEMLPKGQRFNSEYFISSILQKIVDTQPPPVLNQPKRNVVIHMDNATPHRSLAARDFAKKNRLNFCPHPAFSPDLAPSDFYLFGKVKHLLQGKEFESEEELFEAIIEILNGISKEELLSVIDEWERRLNACISNGGNYVD